MKLVERSTSTSIFSACMQTENALKSFLPMKMTFFSENERHDYTCGMPISESWSKWILIRHYCGTQINDTFNSFLWVKWFFFQKTNVVITLMGTYLMRSVKISTYLSIFLPIRMNLFEIRMPWLCLQGTYFVKLSKKNRWLRCLSFKKFVLLSKKIVKNVLNLSVKNTDE